MDVDPLAYAIGYFYGRSVGSDEPGLAEMERRHGPPSLVPGNGWLYASFRDGYARGVSDCLDWDDAETGA